MGDEKNTGDEINVGDIEDSDAVAIGEGAHAQNIITIINFIVQAGGLRSIPIRRSARLCAPLRHRPAAPPFRISVPSVIPAPQTLTRL